MNETCSPPHKGATKMSTGSNIVGRDWREGRMGNGVITCGISIDEAFLQGEKKHYTCPYCGIKERNKNGIINPVWIDKHLKRCKQRLSNLNAEIGLREFLKISRWVMHPKCGRCMVLETRDGLCLVENDHGRYIVAVADIKFDTVNDCLQMIHTKQLSHDQTIELISHLMSKIHYRPVHHHIKIGDKVEFHLNQKVRYGLVYDVTRHNCYVHLESAADYEPNKLNLRKRQIIGVVL